MEKMTRGLLGSTALTRAGLACAGFALIGNPALALPQNGQVVGGSATISQSSPSELDINQSTNRAVLNWQSFSIGGGETTRFIQPNSGSVAVNRVTGIDPSLIAGRLTANGQVVLVNPNGILFDKGAKVDVGGLIASTSNISTANAMAGQMVFDQPSSSSSATIVNRGTITAREGGLVALVAPGVANSGVINARLGKVALASGNSWALDLYGDRLVSFGVGDSVVNQVAGPDNTGIGVTNSGKIYADAGHVELTANIARGIVSNAVNMSGVVEASSIHHAGGTIVLDSGQSGVSVTGMAKANGTRGGTITVAGDSVVNQGMLAANGTSGAGGAINVSANSAYIDTENSSLSASGTSGGTITVTGNGKFYSAGTISATGSAGTGGAVALTAPTMNLIGATVDASGATGGGKISLGGGSIGGDLPSAQTVHVSGSAVLSADAIDSGTGGTITVWSDDATSFGGKASAKGGFSFGKGGTIEVSSAGSDSFAGLADASAPNGTAGQLLLDPKAIVIDASTGSLPQFDLVDPNSNVGGSFGAVIVSLGNGNVVVTDPNDTLGLGPLDTGAAYLFNGITGQLISTLSGTSLNDHVGLSVTALTGSNNFVVGSPNWNGNTGAATFINGATGLSANVSAANSLTGSVPGDEVGLNITALANGNYVVGSPDWSLGKGAATFASGAMGLTGTVGAANSLIGSAITDHVGTSVTALTNGNYVVNSPAWDGTLGAATFANGTAGLTGTVSAANSLVGNVVGDSVGLVTTALENGNYVVASDTWHDGEGAATWGNGTTGLTGTVSSANSLIGSLITDHVGASVTALTNGNYVVGSPSWGLGTGAATFASGATGLTATVSSVNSLIGGAITDHVGASVTALANGNYVVNSPSWGLGKGAATFANGSVGLTGTVTAANSLTGSLITDGAGLFTTALSNGNYVVSLPNWNGTLGGAILGSGTLGLTGTLSAANALTGSNSGDEIGLHVTALADGNYVVGSPDWNGTRGAATWASGTVGLTGTISAGNSLIGSSIGDLVGSTVVPLSAGAYIVVSASFGGGLGAATLGLAGHVLDGTIGTANSIVGTILEGTPLMNVVCGLANGNFYIGLPNLSGGGVIVGTQNPNGLTYADNESGTITITPSYLTQTLDTGTAVTLQANDDITVNSAIVSSAGGDGGNLTLDAGRSLIFNAGITSDNGNITLVANDTAADGVVNADRDPGLATITFNNGAALNAGSGAISIDLKTGAGNTNTGSGGIALQALNAATISVLDENIGTLTLGGQLTATGTGNDIVLSTGVLDNTYGANALDSAGRYIVYATSPLTDTLDGIGNFTKHYGISYAGYAPGNVTSGGDYIFYSLTPTLTISASDLSRLYGSANPSLTFTTSGLIDGDTLGTALSTTPAFTTGATISANVGSYAITAANTPSSLLGYTIVINGGTLTVTPAPLTITANNATRLYGGTNPSFSASYSGLVNNDSSNVVTGLTLTTGATTASTVGSYTITAGNAAASNYTITYISGTLSVTPAPLTVTADNATRLYGGSNPIFGASYSGLVNGDSTNVVTGLVLSSSATPSSNVGTYAITATGGVALDYAISYVNGTLSVTPAPLTISANNATRLYGGTNPSFSASYNGLVAGNTSNVVTGLTLTTSATTASNVGSYAITAGNAIASNYMISYVNGTLAVTPAPLTIAANNSSRLYGGANPSFSASYTGLVNNDSSNVVTGLTLSTSATTASPLGTYAIVAANAMASNYTISYGANGTLTVDPATLTVIANNASRLYGGSNPTLSASYSGLVNGDNSSVVTGVTLSTAATTASNVGSYTITAGGASASNYTISYVNGTLSVTPAPLTVTAGNATRLYGAANPAFDVTYNGFVNNDGPSSVALSFATAPASAGVGTYALTPVASNPNYQVTAVSGTYTITPAPLVITPNDITRAIGADEPPFSATFTSLVNGDSPSVLSGLTFTSPGTISSGPGAYPITASGAVDPNYTISYGGGGTLTIVPMTQPPVTSLPQMVANIMEDTGSGNQDTATIPLLPIAVSTTRGALQAFSNSELAFQVSAFTPPVNQLCLKLNADPRHRSARREDEDTSCAAPLTINGF